MFVFCSECLNRFEVVNQIIGAKANVVCMTCYLDHLGKYEIKNRLASGIYQVIENK